MENDFSNLQAPGANPAPEPVNNNQPPANQSPANGRARDPNTGQFTTKQQENLTSDQLLQQAAEGAFDTKPQVTETNPDQAAAQKELENQPEVNEQENQKQTQQQGTLDESWDDKRYNDNIKGIAQKLLPEDQEKFKDLVDSAYNNLGKINEKANRTIQQYQEQQTELQPITSTLNEIRGKYKQVAEWSNEDIADEIDEMFQQKAEFHQAPDQSMAKQIARWCRATNSDFQQTLQKFATDLQDANYRARLAAIGEEGIKTLNQQRENKNYLRTQQENMRFDNTIEQIARDPEWGSAYRFIMNPEEVPYGGQTFQNQLQAVKQQYPKDSMSSKIRRAIYNTILTLRPDKLQAGQNQQTNQVPPPKGGNTNTRTPNNNQQNKPRLDQQGRNMDGFDTILDAVWNGNIKI